VRSRELRPLPCCEMRIRRQSFALSVGMDQSPTTANCGLTPRRGSAVECFPTSRTTRFATDATLARAAGVAPIDGGHGNLPIGGHRESPVAATGSLHGWPSDLSTVSS
jgi:hypothetical protein